MISIKKLGLVAVVAYVLAGYLIFIIEYIKQYL